MFEFRVTDRGTGRPIEGATVRHSEWQGRTGPDGSYKLAAECFTAGGSIVYPDWTFTVDAPGYRTVGPLRLITFTGTRGHEIGKRIEVDLTRD